MLDRTWKDALGRGVSLAADDASERYGGAIATTKALGLGYEQSEIMGDAELLQRLKLLLSQDIPQPEQMAVLGLVEEPELTLQQAFERFWEHIRDEWAVLSRDQIRVKKNAYSKAIRNFEKVVGQQTLYNITREHALEFRSWWMTQISKKGYKPHTANRQMSALRRMTTINCELDSSNRQNPFHRVRIKDTHSGSRKPFSTEFIRDELLAQGVLPDLPEPLHLLLRLLVSTGMRVFFVGRSCFAFFVGSSTVPSSEQAPSILLGASPPGGPHR